MLSLPFTVLAVCLYRANSQALAGYGAGGGDGGDYSDYSGGSLEDTIPGTPGLDYPILAEVPDTGFSCDGRVSLNINIELQRIIQRSVIDFQRVSFNLL